MEDKELQQLVEAKLWQLENQRQQEEIASRIGRQRIVWPWWLGTAAAAAILAAVLLSPLLSGKEELVAKAENLEILEKLDNLDYLDYLEPPTHTATTPAEPLPTAPVATADSVPASIPPIEPEPVLPTTNYQLPTTNSPTVHTRRSNRLGDIKKAPEKPKVPALIAHYIDIPDTVLFTSNIVINLK